MKPKELLLILLCQLSMQTCAMNHLMSVLPNIPNPVNCLIDGGSNKALGMVSSVATSEAAVFTGFKTALSYCPVINPFIRLLGLHKAALPLVMFAQTNQSENPFLSVVHEKIGNGKFEQSTYKTLWTNLKDAKYREAFNGAGEIVFSKLPPLIVWGALCARAMHNPALAQIAGPLTLLSLIQCAHSCRPDSMREWTLPKASPFRYMDSAMNTFYACAFGLGILGFKSAKMDHNFVWWGMASLLSAAAMDLCQKGFLKDLPVKLPSCMKSFCVKEKIPLISFVLFGWLLPMYWK